jgi:hypothetical protein
MDHAQLESTFDQQAANSGTPVQFFQVFQAGLIHAWDSRPQPR